MKTTTTPSRAECRDKANGSEMMTHCRKIVAIDFIESWFKCNCSYCLSIIPKQALYNFTRQLPRPSGNCCRD